MSRSHQLNLSHSGLTEGELRQLQQGRSSLGSAVSPDHREWAPQGMVAQGARSTEGVQDTVEMKVWYCTVGVSDFVPFAFAKAGNIKIHSSGCWSV